MNLDPRIFINGGVLGFRGGTNPFKAGIGGVLSKIIDIFDGSDLSHIGIALPQRYWPGGVPYMAECTIWTIVANGQKVRVNGPQFNEIPSRLEEDYVDKGGWGYLREFASGFEPDWDVLNTDALRMNDLRNQGKIRYSILRLVEDAITRSEALEVLPSAALIERLGENDSGLVCCEYGAILMESGGVKAKCAAAGIPWLPFSRPTAGSNIGCTPNDVWTLGNAGVLKAPVRLP
jgi:hypothetical protein